MRTRLSRTRSAYDVRGRDIPLLDLTRCPDENGVSDVLAAVWDRLPAPARFQFLEGMLAASGLSGPPAGTTVEVWREVRWVTPDGHHNQRIDLVLYARGWGTVAVEVKVRQREWEQSGPTKFPEYAAQLARAASLAPKRFGDNLILLALTPLSIPPADLGPSVAGVQRGALTLEALRQSWKTLQGTTPMTAVLLGALDTMLLNNALGVNVPEAPVIAPSDLSASLDGIRTQLETAQAVLVAVKSELTSLGLDDVSIRNAEKVTLSDPLLLNPWLWGYPTQEALFRPELSVAIMFCLDQGTILLILGLYTEEADSKLMTGFGSQLGDALTSCDGLLRNTSAVLETYPATPAGAAALDAVAFEDDELRGMFVRLPLIEDGETSWGPMLPARILKALEERLFPLADTMGQLDISGQPRPKTTAVIATLRTWEEAPEGLPDKGAWPHNPGLGWTKERAVSLWVRRMLNDSGKPTFDPKASQAPITSTAPYLCLDKTVRCCGVEVERPSGRRWKVTCPVCERRWAWRQAADLPG